MAWLRDARCPCILGNQDEFLLEPELIRSYTEAPVVVDSVDWCRAELGHRGAFLLDPGSLGLPFRSFVDGRPALDEGADYAIVEAISEGRVSIDLRRVPVDRARLRAAAAATSLPLAPMLRAEYA